MDIIIKGNICHSTSPEDISVTDGGYLVCSGSICKGIFRQENEIPPEYRSYPIADYTDNIIIPGLCDLHTHAPQFAFRGLGTSLELLQWLETYTYPEEIKYSSIDYAEKAYGMFADALTKSATTRACIFATVHLPATLLLMEKLEKSGIVSYAGLVNMDRNCPEALCTHSVIDSYKITRQWIEQAIDKYENTKPVITPRFVPTCSDELMVSLKTLQTQFSLPVQSHLSENAGEIKWVRELHPDADSYAGVYNKSGLFGGGDAPAVMAHCIWCGDKDIELLKRNKVYVAHCPGSNMNLASGIAPIRKYMSLGINIGLGSDVAGGNNLSIFRAISDAVQVSKLYWRIIDSKCKPLTFNEAFYLATKGGGSFFGNAGSFDEGCEFDAVVLGDGHLPAAYPLTTHERLERITYSGGDECVKAKYVRGKQVNP